jgi:hypothetical protein
MDNVDGGAGGGIGDTEEMIENLTQEFHGDVRSRHEALGEQGVFNSNEGQSPLTVPIPQDDGEDPWQSLL